MIDVRRSGPSPWRVGHRGAAALAPENTLPSLERALAEGVDFVEFDVVALADGTLVLSHSDDLRDLSGGTVRGHDGGMDLYRLRQLAPALTTLDEALAFLAEQGARTGVHVDVKHPGHEAEIVTALRRHGVAERSLVSSFFAQTLRGVGELEPAIRLGLSYPLDRSGLARRRVLAPLVVAALLGMRRALPHRIVPWLQRAGATVACLHYFVVTRAVVARCHAAGAAVFAWTVDDRRALARLSATGVDGVITNDPRIFAGTLTP